jgi:putative glutamine amidotransferase
MRPLVGVTISCDDRRPGFFSLRQDYVRAIEKAGGLPVVLTPGAAAEAAELLERIEGLVLTGGGDIDPALYGQARHASVIEVQPERDVFEVALARRALDRDVPLLAICRGQQVLNVATGGTLIQDIASSIAGAENHDPERERWELSHDVRIQPGSRLARILGRDRVAVNSFHHQAVKDLGQGLEATAWAVDDGVVEAIEAPDRRFAVGVQWHPESFWDRPGGFAPLFEAFVGAAADRR